MTRLDTVAIVGVGMIGGSLGLAIKDRRAARKVIGIGRTSSSLMKASRLGQVDRTTTDLAQGVADADLVIVCAPVAKVAPLLKEAALHSRPDALFTDAASTKHEIIRDIARSADLAPRFIGSHPLAGSEKSGPEAAVADLLLDRTVIVTPVRTNRAEDIRRICRFWESLGAHVVRMSPEEHDRIVAATSHVPHIVSSILAAATPSAMLPLVARGWLDTTRVAAGDPELWKEIVASNRVNVLKALSRFERVFASFRGAVEQRDWKKLNGLLERAMKTRTRLENDALGS
jgi:prephenate dehydrogenase